MLGTNIAKTGCEIIANLYETKKVAGRLNDLRLSLFQKSIARSSFHLGSLPPTEGAAAQHCYLTYLQLQTWLGYQHDPEKWGWKIANNTLQPVYSSDLMIPEDIIKKIACRCESGCKTNTCGCKKDSLNCSSMCLRCNDEICQNFEKKTVVTDDVDEDFDEPNSLETEKEAANESDSDDDKNIIESQSNSSDEESLQAKRRKIN